MRQKARSGGPSHWRAPVQPAPLRALAPRSAGSSRGVELTDRGALGRFLTGRVTPPSSLRPCLCPRTPGTRPPCAPRTWDRGRRSIHDTRGTHPPRGRVASSTRYAPCSPSSSGCQLCSSAPLIKNESPARPSHGIPLTGQWISLERAFSADCNAARVSSGLPPRAPSPRSADSSQASGSSPCTSSMKRSASSLRTKVSIASPSGW